MVGRSEVVIQDTRNLYVNCEASISVVPFDIHIMKKEFVSNMYEAYIDKNNKVVISEEPFDCDVTQLIPGSTLDEDGYLVDKDGKLYDLTDADVKVEIGLKDIEIVDDEEEGNITGEIVSTIYKGDHYQVIVRTEEDEDFVVDTEYTWNEFDRVNVKIAPEKIKMTLKLEAKNYVKD
jgi:spermidine/putrescine transport system ATP-binding protein